MQASYDSTFRKESADTARLAENRKRPDSNTGSGASDEYPPLERIKDFIVYWRYWILNWLKIVRFGLSHDPITMLRLRSRHPWIAVLAKANNLHTTFCRGRRGNYLRATAIVVTELISGVTETARQAFFGGKDLVLHEDMVPPEIIRAMGLSPYMVEFLGIVLPMVVPGAMEGYIDTSENHNIPPDICSLPKSTMGLVLEGHLPPGKVVVTSNLPCDGGMASYALIERVLKKPVLRLDVPFNFYNDRAVAYFAEELKRMIGWLEENTSGRMDWEELRRICDERNRMAEIEQEIWEMLRVRPAPMAGEAIYLNHLYGFNVAPGKAHSTRIFEKVRRITRENLESGQGANPNEKYRALLWNPPFLHCIDLFNWAETVWGVSLLIDSMSFNRIPLIDTSTPEQMLRGLARTIMAGPMARHTRGPGENYLEDIFYICRHFDIDMLWVAGHVGCKNTAAMNGILRERCRDIGLPLLIVDYDLSDTRVVSHDGIRKQVNHFMENIMKAERLAEDPHEKTRKRRATA